MVVQWLSICSSSLCLNSTENLEILNQVAKHFLFEGLKINSNAIKRKLFTLSPTKSI